SCIFGGYQRSRISSQCIKRAIRNSEIFKNELDGVALGIRTRRLPSQVKKRLIEKGVDEEVAIVAAKIASGFGNKEGKPTKKGDITQQIMFFSQAELDALVELFMYGIKDFEAITTLSEKEKNSKIKKLAKDLQKELLKIFKEKKISPVSPDIALFGRMITSDAFQDVEASMQVAHAISTNKFVHEFDFYTAVDDLTSKEGADLEEQGAGMMGDIEYNSACYYKYFSQDSNGFIENIRGVYSEKPKDEKDEELKELLEKTIRGFIKAAIYVTPTGKQNSFAAHQLPSAILIEVRPEKIPVSYANAFLKPCNPEARKNRDLVMASIEKLAKHVEKLTTKYSLPLSKRLWFSIVDESEDEKLVKEVNKKIESVPDGDGKVEICNTIDDLLTKLEETIQSEMK
ncbi:MAG: type I-E CRISPR-associated protein Cas7/Cse4/CasC, partial [Promethearchaeota archaeon]